MRHHCSGTVGSILGNLGNARKIFGLGNSPKILRVQLRVAIERLFRRAAIAVRSAAHKVAQHHQLLVAKNGSSGHVVRVDISTARQNPH